jgi:hypothetical protein
MARMSLLEIVQDILSDMNSDNVNSIDDTIEAGQVARMVRSTFMNLYNDRVWPRNAQAFRLTSMADSAKPTHMRMEDEVTEVLWIKYNIAALPTDPIKYRDITYKTPEEFLDLVMARDASLDYAETVIDYNGTPLIIYNNVAPTYYTSFDDEHLVFDSYDNTMDSVLQHSKTQAFGYVEPEFQMVDTFVPQIPAKATPYFLSECKSVCHLKIKEVFSQKDEQNSNRQKSWLSRRKSRIADKNRTRYPNYGRK